MNDTFPWTCQMSELAKEAGARLADGLHADAVWVFGSVARNEITPNSDLDLLVVVKESHEPRYRRAQRALRLLSDIHAPKDVIVMTAEEWEFEGKVTCSLGSTVRREGVLLYERGKK